ncbi:MAG: peptidylprolyl isomerase, partial [Marinobacter sp.]
LLRERADDLLAELRDGEASPEGDDWTRYKDVDRNRPVVPEPVQVTAFSLPSPGDEEFVFGTAEVDSDLVIVALSDVTDGEVDKDSEDVRNMSQFLAQLNGQQEYQAYVQTLRERAEIERP